MHRRRNQRFLHILRASPWGTKAFMVRLEFSTQLAYDVAPPGADFIFNIQAAYTSR